MTVTLYKSTDASAPSLTGQVGSLAALLDAILVNGYGSKSAQGWSIAFTATNQRSYKMPAASNFRYLNVNDDGTGAATYARVTGYETMSAFNTGTGAFPTAAQFTSGLYCHKSSTADATARPWYALGNGAFFMLFVWTDQTLITAASPTMGGIMFGDFTSYVAGDTWNTVIVAGTTTSAAQASANNHQWVLQQVPNAVQLVGHYCIRAYSGVGSSVQCSKFANPMLAGVSAAVTSPKGFGAITDLSGNTSGSNLAYPNPPDASLLQDRIWIYEGGMRGEIPGLWALAPGTFSQGDTWTGSGALSGKSFEIVRATLPSVMTSVMGVETSNTW